MKMVYKNGAIEVWEVTEKYGSDFYVYGCYRSGDPKVCPSLPMAMQYANTAA